MLDKLNTIMVNGKEYPYKCDMKVLAEIQEEYESVNEFEMKLLGLKIVKQDKKGNPEFEKGEPSIKAIMFALPLMIQEGIEIARDAGEDIERINTKEFVRELKGNYIKLATEIHNEFKRAFETKNE